MSNRPGTFVKGDLRCWRKGRPRSFDAARELALAIAHEPAIKDDKPEIINGHIKTIVEKILREWAVSNNPILQKAFMEIAFGKVPDSVNIKSKSELILKLDPYNYEHAIAAIAPRPGEDSAASSED